MKRQVHLAMVAPFILPGNPQVEEDFRQKLVQGGLAIEGSAIEVLTLTCSLIQ